MLSSSKARAAHSKSEVVIVRYPLIIIIVIASLVAGGCVERAPRSVHAVTAATPTTWVGAVEVSAAFKLKMTVHIDLTAETATLDIPTQQAMRLALSDVQVKPGSMRFLLRPPGAADAASAQFDLAVTGDVATGTMTQMGRRFAARFERAAGAGEAPVSSARPQTPTGDPPYRVERYTWPGPGGTLAGTLTLPGGDGPFPAVLLVTGSGQQDRDETIFGHKPFWVIADHLTRHGIGVLRVDDRGVGSSTGDVNAITLQTNADDVRASLAYLRARPGVDPARVGLVGHSEGGVLAAMVAADNPEVAFVVSLAGAAVRGDLIIMDQFETMLRTRDGFSDEAREGLRAAQRRVLSSAASGIPKAQLRAETIALMRTLAQAEGQRPDPKTLASQADMQLAALGSAWFHSFVIHDPATDWVRVQAPTLVLNGSLDTQVSARLNTEAMEAALKAGGNPRVTVAIRDGLNHLFQPAKTGMVDEYATIETTFDVATLRLMTRWIQSQVGQ